jgi:hypothetical protein
MKTKYLSHAQACAISRDYQYLHGEVFDGSHKIDLVTVAPYSRILQWQYLQSVLYEGRSESARTNRNPSGRYDVIVVTKSIEEPGFIVKDLRTYLKAAGITFDESRYACLRNHSIPPVILRQLLG